MIMSDPSLLDEVEEEFMDYQAMSDNEVPQRVWDAALVGDIRDNQHRMDVIWGYLKERCQFLSFPTAMLAKSEFSL